MAAPPPIRTESARAAPAIAAARAINARTHTHCAHVQRGASNAHTVYARAINAHTHTLCTHVQRERLMHTRTHTHELCTHVQRGLCQEGLGDWTAAVADYSRAIALWGGGRGEGINPFVLTFRANALAKLGQYSKALEDYRASEVCIYLSMCMCLYVYVHVCAFVCVCVRARVCVCHTTIR